MKRTSPVDTWGPVTVEYAVFSMGVWALSQEEAEGMAYRKGHEFMPLGEGWRHHLVHVIDLGGDA